MRCVGVAVSFATLFVLGGRAPAAFSGDNDGDGIDDDLEQQLAERFFPQIIYSFYESCSGPEPKPFLFRARHPSVYGVVHTEYILINYVQLYDDDCGPNGHSGDNESFATFLRWNGGDWEFASVSATAHWADVCETMTARGTPDLWVGSNKHGTYADPNACGCWGSDVCSSTNGHVLPHILYNVGEPDHQLINDLGVVKQQWQGIPVWWGWRFLNAGVITDQLYFTRYVAGTITPEAAACNSQCEATYNDCMYHANGSGDQYICQQQLSDCYQQQCAGWNHWDQ